MREEKKNFQRSVFNLHGSRGTEDWRLEIEDLK